MQGEINDEVVRSVPSLFFRATAATTPPNDVGQASIRAQLGAIQQAGPDHK